MSEFWHGTGPGAGLSAARYLGVQVIGAGPPRGP